jgi:hypothetical protein
VPIRIRPTPLYDLPQPMRDRACEHDEGRMGRAEKDHIIRLWDDNDPRNIATARPE